MSEIPGAKPTPAQPSPDPSSIKPLDVDGVNAVIAGIICWVILLVVLLVFFRTTLTEHDATWFLWTCVSGIAIGLLGLPYVLRRRAVYRRAGGDADEAKSDS